MLINELENAGHLNDTLIIYTSDNGPPFLNGRTNLYDYGIREPLLISNPLNSKLWRKVCQRKLFSKMIFLILENKLSIKFT